MIVIVTGLSTRRMKTGDIIPDRMATASFVKKNALVMEIAVEQNVETILVTAVGGKPENVPQVKNDLLHIHGIKHVSNLKR